MYSADRLYLVNYSGSRLSATAVMIVGVPPLILPPLHRLFGHYTKWRFRVHVILNTRYTDTEVYDVWTHLSAENS